MSAVVALCKYLTSMEECGKVADGWKMANAEREQLFWTFANKDAFFTEDQMKRMLVMGTNRQWILDLLELQGKPDLRAVLRDWEVPVFPVTGQDLIDAGFKPGPQFKQILDGMKHDWIASDYTETKASLLPYARMYA